MSQLGEPPALGGDKAQWMALRPRAGPSILDLLTDDDDAALLSTARGLALWHRSIRFCSNCGSSDVRMYRGGKRCESCGTRFRPRLDTSIIVLVTSQSRCLLGRKAAWPAGRWDGLRSFSVSP